ncbi:MAG TPA: oxidoreductase [Ktedonobacteraceae bacterium]|jgi:NAD(P)-dependent dehydrogenase (short-subunit alcohol dehydrogenase family)
MAQWTTDAIPSLQGQVALITGANIGLGFETARILAARDAHVILACRDLAKAHKAQANILAVTPGARIDVLQLDLASLTSVKTAAEQVQQTYQRLDLLFNNAGVMAIPRQDSADGFEMQFAVNYLGHFALTGLLLSLLLSTPQSRVITLTSQARSGKVNFADLQGGQRYTPWGAYGQSKTADLLFAFELQQRLAQIGASTISVAAHPGYANTNLQQTTADSSSLPVRIGLKYIGPLFAQSAAMGALPQLYAATSPEIHGGELVGPTGFGGMRGLPGVVSEAQKEYDRPVAARLWEVGVQLTGIDYAALNTKTKA